MPFDTKVKNSSYLYEELNTITIILISKSKRHEKVF